LAGQGLSGIASVVLETSTIDACYTLASNTTVMPPIPPTEAERQTRQDRIDPKLKAAGWSIVPFDPNRPLSSYDRCAIQEYQTENSPADYALCVNGTIVGIVEAKKLTLGPQNVLMQAERYSRGATTNPLNFHGFHVPFLYSTNGEVFWHHDIRNSLGRSEKIAQFHTPDALTERLAQDFDDACRTLLATPNTHPRLRDYQRDANTEIEKAISNRKRHMLIAMATGTGKTFTMVNEVYRLMKSGVAKRILFLVDRRALAAQAVLAFASHEPEPGLKFDKIYEMYSQRFHREDFDEDQKFDPKVLPTSYLTNPQSGHAFVYVSTIQRMTINLLGRNAIWGIGDEEIEDDADKLDIPIHAFDLVIADECHRGYPLAGRSLRVGYNFAQISDQCGLCSRSSSGKRGHFYKKLVLGEICFSWVILARRSERSGRSMTGSS
jgi:type I restriction enzyme R subunit